MYKRIHFVDLLAQMKKAKLASSVSALDLNGPDLELSSGAASDCSSLALSEVSDDDLPTRYQSHNAPKPMRLQDHRSRLHKADSSLKEDSWPLYTQSTDDDNDTQ